MKYAWIVFLSVWYISAKFFSVELYGFSTVADVVAYCAQTPEYPDSDTNDWLNPVYDTLYTSMRPGLVNRFFTRLGIRRPLWQFSHLEDLLQRTYKVETEEISLVSDPISSDRHQKLIVIGDLLGSLHSFSRIVAHLMERKFITNQFAITDPNLKFVFLGNFIGNSPYCLELLTVLLQLKERNPDRIVILRGWHEDRQRWAAGMLGTELLIRANLSEKSRRLVHGWIENFFHQLPRAFAVSNGTDSVPLLCASSDAVDELLFKKYGECNDQLAQALASQCVRKQKSVSSVSGVGLPCPIRVIISTRKNWNTINPMPSLEYTPADDEEPPRWVLISGQNRSYRAFYRCRWEGYIVIDGLTNSLQNGLKDESRALLEHWARRVDREDPFVRCQSYNLITGQQAPERSVSVNPKP